MDADNIFRSICAGFNATPDACFTDYDENTHTRKSSTGIGKGTILAIIVLVVLINVLLIYCYRRYTQREIKEEMQLQISSMMSQYFALSDTKDKKSFANPSESTLH